MAGVESGRGADDDAAARQAAEVAVELSEAAGPEDKKRITKALQYVAGRGAEAVRRGSGAARRGAGTATGTVARTAGGARKGAGSAGRGVTSGLNWLTAQVVAMGPRLQIRDQATLRAQFPGRTDDDIAGLLVERAARATATVGGATGACAALPALPAFPVEVAAETLAVVGIEIKLLAELHEIYGMPAAGSATDRARAYVGAWASRRGVYQVDGGLLLIAGSPLATAADQAAGGAGAQVRLLAQPAADRRARGGAAQPQGDAQARPPDPRRPAQPPHDLLRHRDRTADRDPRRLTGPGRRRMAGSAATDPAPGLRYASAAGRWVLAATVLGSGIAALDATVVGIALPAIARDFHASVSSTQWVVDGYTLPLAGLLLLGGALGDAFGRRKVFVIGTIWFAIASLACGLAPNAGFLIAARAVQGAGAALLVPGSLAIIQASFAKQDRARAIGAWSGLGGVATAIGPFLGGWLISAVSWRLVFFINLPAAAAVVAISVRHVPESRAPGPRQPLDAAGATTISLALAGITYGLIAASDGNWASPTVLGTLLPGVALLVAFCVIESRSPHAMLPLTIFRSRQFSGANARHLRRLRRPRRRSVPDTGRASGGVRLQRARGRGGVAADHGHHAHPVGQVGRARRPDRPEAADDDRAAGDRGRPAAADPGARQRGLPDPGASGRPGVRVRPGDQRGAAHLDRAVGGARRAFGHRLGRQQRRVPGGQPHRGGGAAAPGGHNRRHLPASGRAHERLPQGRADRRRGRGARRRAGRRDHPQPGPGAAGQEPSEPGGEGIEGLHCALDAPPLRPDTYSPSPGEPKAAPLSSD